jgi:hypothetical protein
MDSNQQLSANVGSATKRLNTFSLPGPTTLKTKRFGAQTCGERPMYEVFLQPIGTLTPYSTSWPRIDPLLITQYSVILPMSRVYQPQIILQLTMNNAPNSNDTVNQRDKHDREV